MGYTQRVTKHCEHCGRFLSLPPSTAARRRFCSRQCRHEASLLRPKKRCEYCGKEYDPPWRNTYNRSRFCSRSCGASAMHRDKGHLPPVTFSCATCGKEFTTHYSKVKNGARFCSRKCCDKSKYAYRIWAHSFYQERCCDCGYDLHPEILVVHHIDHNRRNNAKDNLVLLCPNCHILRHASNGRVMMRIEN